LCRYFPISIKNVGVGALDLITNLLQWWAGDIMLLSQPIHMVEILENILTFKESSRFLNSL
jgi:hypothetical protein